MKELIDHIPFIDLIIVALLGYFLYVGWRHGFPKLAMAVGALYAGFLLASIYYHLFAAILSTAFNLKPGFFTDFLGFCILDVMITLLMIVLLFGLFGHLRITGRWSIFDKIGGTLSGFLAALMILIISIGLLRVPHETALKKLDTNSGIPAVDLFNDGYTKSALAPVFVEGAPYLLASTKPMLPLETQEKGAVPLLETLVTKDPFAEEDK